VILSEQEKDPQLSFFRLQVQAGMDQAAEMLSRFLEGGHKFRIHKTKEETLLADWRDQHLAGVCLEVEGIIKGAILLVFSADNACRLAGLLLRQNPPTDLKGDPLRSTLNEVGNIFASGVLASLDDQIKLRAYPSPPTFLSGPWLTLKEQCHSCCLQHEPSLVQARLDCDTLDGVLIEGQVFFQLAAESLEQFIPVETARNVDSVATP
jgi:CheY-specific phosphatase CheX